ncbi:MAG: flagellar export protein FliJ [Nitrospirae bacterium]|nr:flagellar export protein FliJ [Nitrospirota bacterium]
MRKNRTISKLLKIKDNRKKEIEIEVKKAADRVDEEKSKLNSLEKDFTDTLEFFNEKNFEGTMDINNINSYYDFFSRINGKISEQKNIHDHHNKELKSLKNNLVEAHKEKKVFEILNDKAIRKDIKDQLSSEQKEADFFAISRRLK